jgi:eukaryotic-like serine/threonine-protein kinase
MSLDRFKAVEHLYHAALEIEPERRSAFLAEACAGDESLRSEVQMLLGLDLQASEFLEEPEIEVVARQAATRPLNSLIGRQLGPYKLHALIGSGGMGEVYRAEDTRLRRNVAVKVLPAAVAGDPQQLQRLEREARALAAINHPNIAAIYGLEESAGIRALVLELVPGRSLAERLSRGPLPLEQALSICRQIAAGLEFAHERGVVHRDIKPANVMITPDGVAKILDFGLARPVMRAPDDSQTKWLTDDLTTPGAVYGTVSYMSPEQARGVQCDERTDIWAFGCLAYETLTGRRLFAAATLADTLLQIVGNDADLRELPPSTPPRVRQLIERCVRRDPKRRLRHIGDARLELEDLQEDTSEMRSGLFEPPPRRRLPWIAVLFYTVLAGLAGWALHEVFAKRRPVLTVQVHRLTDVVGLEETPAISPDGKTVAFVAEAGGRRQIWVRILRGGTPLAVTKDDADHYGPRWSPDSASLLYYTPGKQPGEMGTIWEISALGGNPQRLVSALGPGDLSHDGKRLAFFRFREASIELAVASRDGSHVRAVGKPLGRLLDNPRWAPDDRQIAFLEESGGTDFSASLLVQNLSGGEPRRVFGGSHYLQGFAWMLDGRGLIVSSAQGSTMAYPPSYNLWLVPIGGAAPVQLTFGEVSYHSPDIARDGRCVVSRVRAQSDLWKLPVGGEPADNAKRGQRITRQTGQVQTVSVSPDEKEIVFLSDTGGHSNVWAARITDGEMRPITREFEPRVLVAVPLWSPRGDLITFLSSRNTTTADVTLWTVKPDGSDARDLGLIGVWACWSGDGQWLYYSDLSKGVYRIRKVHSAGGQPVTVREDNALACVTATDGSVLYYSKLLAQATGVFDYEIRAAKPENGPSEFMATVSGSRVPGGAVNFQPYLSPDGKWLAMALNDGSTSNLWALSTSNHTWRQLTDFRPKNVVITRRIAWSRDGNHLYAAVSEVDADVVMLSGLTR